MILSTQKKELASYTLPQDSVKTTRGSQLKMRLEPLLLLMMLDASHQKSRIGKVKMFSMQAQISSDPCAKMGSLFAMTVTNITIRTAGEQTLQLSTKLYLPGIFK